MAKMTRLLLTLGLSLFALTACTGNPNVGADGRPVSAVFRIGIGEKGKIQYRVLDSVNAFREASGMQKLALSAELTAAAATHSRDMSIQNRPWHFGSDGSSPIDRVARAGYTGTMRGENISETFESDVETLAAWMQEDPTKDVILDEQATDLGVAWYQEPNGKIWWTLVTGSSPNS